MIFQYLVFGNFKYIIIILIEVISDYMIREPCKVISLEVKDSSRMGVLKVISLA
jgi:hypothetical protein